ncbi:hypothetical protein JTB14_006415 [Gonioctena quinquepunctata]|nr:hypothetical protein JTB14_006415 [Gonioctena quinquepunctata]
MSSLKITLAHKSERTNNQLFSYSYPRILRVNIQNLITSVCKDVEDIATSLTPPSARYVIEFRVSTRFRLTKLPVSINVPASNPLTSIRITPYDDDLGDEAEIVAGVAAGVIGF